MKKVALFGGSFNPIHNGHIALSRAVIANGLASEVWLLVSPQNPLKLAGSQKPEQVRYALAQCALAKEPYIKASDFEFSLPRPSFTWRTLCALRQAYPTIDFSLLIGADNWQCFDHWAHFQDILASTPLIVYPRPGYEGDTSRWGGRVHLLANVPLLEVSSTIVRECVQQSLPIDSLVPPVIVADVCRIYAEC